MRKRSILLICTMLLAAISGWAQTVIRTEVHNIVEVGERFNLVFVVEGEHTPSDFQWEAGDDFNLVWGPQKGSSTSIQIVNGKATRSSQTSYTYILQAKQTGTFTLNAATARVRGKDVQSQPVSIQVVSGGSSSAAGSQASSPSSSSTSDNADSSTPSRQQQGDVFLRLSLSRNSVVVGEAVTATLKIYHRTNLVGFENARFPAFKGFWSQEVESPANIEFQREQLNGVMYQSAVLRRWVLIPQKAGEQAIEPAEIVCLVNVQRPRSRRGSVFDDFFADNYVTTRQRVSTPPATLHVSALPEGAPASFGGGVGELRIQDRVSKDSLRAHDAASLIITVSGKGNIALLEAPTIKFPPDFEVYDVKTTVNTDKSGTTGSKTFEYPFIPRSHGDFVIGPIPYSYYDVKQRGYVTLSAAAIPVHVAKGAGSSAATSPAGGNTLTIDRKGVKNLGEDIRFIRSKTQLDSPKDFLVHRPAYWIAIVALLLSGLGLWLGMRKAAARRADVVGTRKRGATRKALKRLSQANEFLQKNLYTAFYEELHRSLLGFVADKLSMDMADQSKENIADALTARGVSPDVAAGFTALLDACEFARYSPDAGHEAMNAHYEDAVKLITAIDSSMKNTPSGSGKAALLLALLVTLGAPAAHAAETSYPDSLWNAAVNAYTEGDYAGARKDFEDVAATGLMSRELYYNLGNACYKTGDIAPAILWYERALRLDPSDKDVRYNLEMARAATQDRIDEIPEILFEQWGRKMCYSLPSNTWAWLSILFVALTVALSLLFLLGRSSSARRVGFFTGIVTLLLALLGWDMASWQRKEAQRQDLAIVMRPVSVVKSSPSQDSAKDLFILHEGTRVKILDSVASFTNIELADGRQGWLETDDIEVI